MPSPVKIKFSAALPFPLEMKLVHDYGFAVHSRKHGHWIIFAKNEFKKSSVPDTNLLAEADRNYLIKRFNKIVDFYVDPSQFVGSIRARVCSMADNCKPVDRQFLLELLEKYYPKEAATKKVSA